MLVSKLIVYFVLDCSLLAWMAREMCMSCMIIISILVLGSEVRLRVIIKEQLNRENV